MAALSDAMERAVKRKRSVLILGPNREPEALSQQIRDMVQPHDVLLCDWRSETPSQDSLVQELENGLRADAVVHVAIGTDVDPRLLDTLVSVISDGRLPGKDRDRSLTGVIVLSSTARWASELGGALNEFFPIQVGAAE